MAPFTSCLADEGRSLEPSCSDATSSTTGSVAAMAPSTAFPAEDDPNKPCEKCGAPASWADDWTKNLTFDDGLALHMSKYVGVPLPTFPCYYPTLRLDLNPWAPQFMAIPEAHSLTSGEQLASPRMWPIGYISNGPYSPFYVEREIPQKNWRDAFEDLLALDSGGQMIDSESRSREAVVAEQLWKQKIHKNVSLINEQLAQDQKYMSLVDRMRAAFLRNNDIDAARFLDEATLPAQKDLTQKSVARAESQIALLKENETQGRRPASTYKGRLEWIASLVSSGAITGWQANLYDSSDGLYAHYGKLDQAENAKPDGLSVTEIEIDRQFEEGIPSRPGSPYWSTVDLRYPESFSPANEISTQDSINDPADDDAEPKDPLAGRLIVPKSLMPTSILAQNIMAERSILRNGKMSVNVLLTNHHTNGTVVKKEIRDDPCRVMEEMNAVFDSMEEMQYALERAIRQQQTALHEDAVKIAEDDDLD